jgi:hypothetical protein
MIGGRHLIKQYKSQIKPRDVTMHAKFNNSKGTVYGYE